jgi:hypothetical protein
MSTANIHILLSQQDNLNGFPEPLILETVSINTDSLSQIGLASFLERFFWTVSSRKDVWLNCYAEVVALLELPDGSWIEYIRKPWGMWSADSWALTSTFPFPENPGGTE